MKRHELVRHVEFHCCELLREGGKHSLYFNPSNRSWTYSGTEGATNKFMHFRPDGSADWGYANSKYNYLEWEIDGDSMLIRQYPSKRSAQMSRLTALVFGPRGGDVFEIVAVSDDEFTLRREYRDHATGEIKSGTTVFVRMQDETTEFVDSDRSP